MGSLTRCASIEKLNGCQSNHLFFKSLMGGAIPSKKIIAKNETFVCRSGEVWYYHLSVESNTSSLMNPIASHLATLTTVRYEKEDGLREYNVVRFEGVKLSKKSGKEYATFIVKVGDKEETKNLFIDQIQ